MTGAIEFLKHLQKWCNNQRTCLDCKFNDEDGEGLYHCRIGAIIDKTDNEIADLVREVERWNRERSKDD